MGWIHATVILIGFSTLTCVRSADHASADLAGIFVYVPDAPGTEILRAACADLEESGSFECTDIFESGVFGVGTFSDVIRSTFGEHAEGPGEFILQDLTEGSIHPHSIESAPYGLASVSNLAGREIRQRRLADMQRPIVQQNSAPYYLTILQDTERSLCRSQDVPETLCLGLEDFKLSHGGANVEVYSVGEDIDVEHDDLRGRVSSDKYVGRRIGEHREFCEDWQGTHVASLAVGHVHGVAKLATVIPVAVKPGCRLPGSALDLAKGLQWAIERRRRTPDTPAVMFLSTKLAVTQGDRVAIDIVEDLVRVIVNELSMTIIATAGANAEDATMFTPGRMDEVITVGGLEVYHEISLRSNVVTTWSASNYGSAIDIWSPASFIDAASPSPSANNATATFSGVPQASAIVAGVVASMLEYSPHFTPHEVKSQLRLWSSETMMVMTRPRNKRNVLQVPTDWTMFPPRTDAYSGVLG